MGGKKAFELMLEIGHKSQPLKSKLPNGYTHKWTVFVRGANNSKIEHCIQRVVFQLHDSFANPHREVTEPPYQVKETGYAGFEIPIEIYFKNREKPNHVVFTLDLCLLLDRPHNSSMSEKVKFYNPNKEFEKCLIKTGAKMLPLTKDKKERSDSPPAKKQKSSSLIPSKDMSKQASQTDHRQSSSSHHQSKSSQQNHSHNHSYHNHSSTSSSSSSNNVSNSLFQNQNTSCNNHHHHHSNHHKSSLPKPKSSKEFIDVFGAPIVYNNSTAPKSVNKHQLVKPSETLTEPHRQVKSNESQKHVKSTESQRHVKLVEQQKQIKQIAPQKQIKPIEPQRPIKPIEPQKSIKPIEQQKPIKPIEQQKPIRPIEQQKPIRPIEQQKAPSQPQTAQPSPTPATTLTDSLQVIQTKISSLSDCDRLQKIVDIIEESGEWYNLTPNKFEFDLKRLDRKTLDRIEKCLLL